MTKDELLKLPDMAASIANEGKRIEAMRARLYSPKGLDTRDKVQSSGGNNMLAETVIDLQNKLDARIEKYEQLRAEAYVMIERALTGDMYYVMSLRYVDALSWAEVASIVNVSAATVYRKHRAALSKLFNQEAGNEQ